MDHRGAVLALARPVAVGDVLTASDIRQVRIAAEAGVDTIAWSDSSSVVGQTMAVSLPAGALLTRAEVGQAAMPPAGQAIVAELVKPGQFPPSVAAGAHVLLIETSTSVTAGASGSANAVSQGPYGSWPATVLDVQPLDNEQGTVLTVQVAATQAPQLAAVAAGDLDVVSVATGGR